MTILGWVTLAAGITAGIYVYYMIVCFWRLLRQASEDIRRVRRTINSLPLKRYRREAEGGESGESSSCAICLERVFSESNLLTQACLCSHLEAISL